MQEPQQSLVNRNLNDHLRQEPQQLLVKGTSTITRYKNFNNNLLQENLNNLCNKNLHNHSLQEVTRT